MSTLYLYAVLGGPLPAGAGGLEDEPIEAVPAAGAWLAVGRLQRAPEASAVALRAHDAAVRRLEAMSEAILPARFGQTAADVETLTRRFADSGDRLRAALSLVEGCVQMTLRLLGLTPPAAEGTDPARPGTGYLETRRRLAAGEGFSAEVDGLRRDCAVLVRAERASWSESASRLTFYHLVERAMLASYTAVVERHRPALEQAGRVTISGPWPPYAFANG